MVVARVALTNAGLSPKSGLLNVRIVRTSRSFIVVITFTRLVLFGSTSELSALNRGTKTSWDMGASVSRTETSASSTTTTVPR